MTGGWPGHFVFQMARDPWPGATAESYGLTPHGENI